MTEMDMIRLVGAEFENTDDETIESWIEFVRPMVSKKQFGKLYKQAVALLVCHRMKVAGLGDGAMSGLASAGGGGSGGVSIASISDGGTSLSFNSGAGQWVFTNAELSITSYGQQFIQLVKMCVVPIHIRGEWG